MKIGQPADKPHGVAPQATTPQAAELAAKTQAAHKPPVNAASASAAADASAKVELSSTAASLLAGGASADFDADKVARFSDSIANGTYKVDPGAIADKLIANAQELLVKVKG